MDPTVFRNITLHVAHSGSCGPDDGHQLTETYCPIEFIQDLCNRDLAFVVFDGIFKQADMMKLISLKTYANKITFTKTLRQDEIR